MTTERQARVLKNIRLLYQAKALFDQLEVEPNVRVLGMLPQDRQNYMDNCDNYMPRAAVILDETGE